MMFKDAFSILLSEVIVLLATGHLYLRSPTVWGSIPLILALLFLLFTLYFFRNPSRSIPSDPLAVVSPADGKIISIEECVEDTYLKTECVRVSIFLNVFNVHVNRTPISGTVEYLRYTPGEFAAAFRDCASDKNENNAIGIKGEKCSVLFKQISGLVARRIVSHLNTAQQVDKGELFGMIKFGSRTDVYFPKNIKVNVALGDKVKGGETIIGVIQ